MLQEQTHSKRQDTTSSSTLYTLKGLCVPVPQDGSSKVQRHAMQSKLMEVKKLPPVSV